MAKEIVWSPLAVETFDTIINYFSEKFGELGVINFVSRVDTKIKLIASRPTISRVSDKIPDTYITSINKKTTLIYRYKPKGKIVELIVFWGMQNPDNRAG